MVQARFLENVAGSSTRVGEPRQPTVAGAVPQWRQEPATRALVVDIVSAIRRTKRERIVATASCSTGQRIVVIVVPLLVFG